jgi:hypothetical protein
MTMLYVDNMPICAYCGATFDATITAIPAHTRNGSNIPCIMPSVEDYVQGLLQQLRDLRYLDLVRDGTPTEDEFALFDQEENIFALQWAQVKANAVQVMLDRLHSIKDL